MYDLIIMKIKNLIIMAAGDSTRFWPLENKNLYFFIDKTLINHIIDGLKKIATNIYVVANKSNIEAIRKVIPKNCQIIIQNQKTSGMAGAILSCKNKVNGEALMVNGNDIFDWKSLKKILLKRNKSDEVSLIAKPLQEYFPGGYLIFKDNKLNGIIEKPNPANLLSNLSKLVIDYIKDIDQFIDLLRKSHSTDDNIYEKALTALIQQKKCSYYQYDNDWLTIKYPWHVLPMTQYYLNKYINQNNHNNSQISKSAVIQGPVILGKNVKIGDYAKIVGHSLIGDGTTIADYSLIRQSQIGKNCLIGSYSEIARSYIGDNVSMHRDYIGDSVVGNDVLIGAGVIFANYRFDQQKVKSLINGKKIDTGMKKFGTIIGGHSKIGCNSTFLPGIKVAPDSIIFPHSNIVDDIL